MIASHNVAIRALFAVNPADGTFDCTIFWGSDTALMTSRMGVRLSDGDSLAAGMELADFEQGWGNVLWTLPEGAGQQVRDHYAGITVNLRRFSDGRPLSVEARIYDECVAFRYCMPIAKDSVLLAQPMTKFRAYKEVADDPEVYRSKNGAFLAKGGAASEQAAGMSYTDWHLIFVSDKRDGLKNAQVAINLERPHFTSFRADPSVRNANGDYPLPGMFLWEKELLSH